jgi:FkbM family methyltransferase
MLTSLLKNLMHRPPAAGVSRQATGAPTPSVGEFVDGLLHEFLLQAHETVPDNYDPVRFGYDGVDRSHQFDVGRHAAYLKFFFDNASALCDVWRALDDDESRRLFRRLILYRLLGHLHVAIRPGADWANEDALYAKARTYDRGESRLGVRGMFGPIHHHTDVPAAQGTLALDCWTGNVVYTTMKRQYFLARGALAVGARPGDVVLDAGACFGDTAVYFANAVGERGRVHAFDPLPAHQAVIDFNVAQNALQSRVVTVPLAVGEHSSAPANPSQRASDSVAQPGFSLHGAAAQDIPLVSIDDYAEQAKLQRIDFVKMDIEGYELSALKGARRSLERHRPTLAISLYHRPQDFFEIPLWLKSHFPWYRLHLEHYTIYQEETVLFATAAA